MIKLTLKMSGPLQSEASARRLNESLVRAVRRAFGQTAWDALILMTRRINHRRAPDNSKQKENHPLTKIQKQIQVGHTIPVKFENHLSDPSRYRFDVVRKELAPELWIIAPFSRLTVIPKLRSMGYKVFELVPETAEFLDANLRKMMRAEIGR